MKLEEFLEVAEDLKKKKLYVTVYDNRKEFMSPLNDDGREMFRSILPKIDKEESFIEIEMNDRVDYYSVNNLDEAYKMMRKRGYIE